MNRTIAWAGLGALALAVLASAGSADAGSITYPAGGEYLSGTVTVTWVREVQSNSNMRLNLVVTGIELEPPLCDPCNSGGGGKASFTFDTTQYADSDEYMLQVTETPTPNHGQGNIRYTTNSTFTIDNTDPATQAVLDGPIGAAGWHTGDVTVELLGLDALSGVASTAVVVDGGAASPYGGSFRVTGDGAHTVRFQSTDRAGNVEPPRSVSFRIDAAAPDTAPAVSGAPGANGWFTGPVTTTLTPTDATSGVASTVASVDGAAWAAAGNTVVLGAEGEHSIRFYSTDAAGNVEAADQVAFRIDATAPRTRPTVAGHEGLGGWYTGEVTVDLAATDATSGVASTWVSLGGPVTPYTGSLRVAEDGQHTVSFYSVDAAGNAEAVGTVTFRIDRTAPDTGSAIAGPPGANDWFAGPVTTTLTPSDATSGIGPTFASIDEGPWFVTGLTPVLGTDGPHTIRFFGTDAAGNVEAVDHVAFRIDATAPETTRDIAGHAGTNGWYTSDVVVTLASTDATSGVATTDLALDGPGFSPYTGSIRVVGEGAHAVQYRAADLAGNVEATRSFGFNIDTVAPASAVAVGEPRVEVGRVVYVTSATPIELGAGDATSGVARIEYRLNEGGFETYTGALFVLGEDGEYRLEWRAVDVAGNVEDAQFLRLFLDNTAPGMALDRPQPGGVYVDGVLVAETHPLRVESAAPALGDADTHADTLDFAVATGRLDVRVTAPDAAVGTLEVRFFIDGVLRATDTEAPYAWTWDTSVETLGEHVLVVASEDLLGNVDHRTLRVFTVPTAQEGLERTLAGVLAGTDPVLPREVRDLLARLPAPPEPPGLPPLPEPPGVPPLPEPPVVPPLPAEPPAVPSLPEPPALPPLPL